MKIQFKNAKILTMENSEIIDAHLVVDDKRIIYIGLNDESFGPFDRVIDCQKNLLMPGFKNAHAHSAMVFLRNLADDIDLEDWLNNIVFPREKHLIPSDIFHLNKIAYLEYLTSGITAIYEHYFYPEQSAKAAREFGMRTVLLGTYNPKTTSVDKLNELYRLYNDKKEDLVTYSIGFHAEYTSDEEMIARTKQALDLTHSSFFTHVSETKKEVEECLVRHQTTPLKYLISKGLYDNGGGLFHGIYLNDEEIKIAKQYNITIVSCPCSNAKLASGIAPLHRYLKEGINIALGTDGPASNNSLDMFKEMYLAATMQKLLLKTANAIPAYEILKMATVNAAKAMGLKDSDVLAVNKYADLIMIDLHAPNLKPTNDIISSLVYAGNKSNVVMTMVNGKILYEKGQFFLSESVEEIYHNAEIAKKRLEKARQK
ncbi:MAG TPA: amidohydrolase [Erysipelotrichaceae bacterium]|nr:amidohydrolase [Erysipelotrichaceae bacterium]